MQHATPNRFDAVWIGAVLCIGIAIGFALASLTGGESRARSIGSTAEQHPVGGSRQAERKQINPENLRVDKLGEVPSEETWEVVVRLNPEERKVAAQKFNSLPRNSQTFASIRAFYKAWTQIDPVAAVTGLSLLSEPEAPTIALEKIGEIASPEAARKIAPLVSQMSENVVSQPFKGQALSKLINIWSQVDPVGALAFVEQNPETPGTDLTKLLQHWGGLDPEAALAWLANNPIFPSKAATPVALYDSVFTGWLVRDALPAANYVAQHLDVPEIRSSLGRATWDVQEFRPESFDNWIENLPDEETRIEAIKRASDFAAPTDPAAIAQWVATQPLNEEGDALILPLTLWLEKDSEAAFKWIKDLPTSVRDSAIQIVCGNPFLDRQKRLQLVELVAKHERRVSALEVLLHEWFAEEPASAEAWLQHSTLSNREKASLLASEKKAD